MRTATVLFLLSFIALTKSSKTKNQKLADGWEEATWRKFKDAKIVFVCPDEAKICESNIRWENLAQKLEDSTELWMIDDENDLQIRNQSLLAGEDLERMKQDVCDLVIVKQMEDESFVKYYTPNRCRWTKVRTKTRGYEERTINEPSNTNFKNHCYDGAGWKGELEKVLEDEGRGYRSRCSQNAGIA